MTDLLTSRPGRIMGVIPKTTVLNASEVLRVFVGPFRRRRAERFIQRLRNDR